MPSDLAIDIHRPPHMPAPTQAQVTSRHRAHPPAAAVVISARWRDDVQGTRPERRALTMAR